jgi:drug/metabolite transporter (DMT)-like permease
VEPGEPSTTQASITTPTLPTAPDRGETRLALPAAISAVVLFATGPIIVADSTLNGLVFAFWRMWLATALANLGLFVIRRRHLDRRILLATAAPGIALGANMAFFFSAVQTTSVANATLISVMTPIPLLFAGRLFFGESATARDLGWILLALTGAAVMVRSANSAGTGDLGGDLLAAGSMASLSVYFAMSKRARASIDTLAFTTGLFTWGAIALTPIVFASGRTLTGDAHGASTWIRIGLVVLLPGAGHVLTAFSHRGVPLAVIGILQLFTPIGASLLALWWLDQSVTGIQVAGMVVVLGALAAFTYQRARPARPLPPVVGAIGAAGAR